MVGTAQCAFVHPTRSANSTSHSPSPNDPSDRFACIDPGEGLLIISTVAAQRRAMFVLALTLAIAGTRLLVTQAWGAGAFAIGQCGAYGQAYDYPGEAQARAAALK